MTLSGEASGLRPGIRQKEFFFRIYIGVMASGDEDIVDRSRAEEIHRQTGAVAIAWEGAGGARASRFSGVPYVEVRVISDAADHKAPKDFDANLENVMMHIGWMIVRWLKNQKSKLVRKQIA